MASLERRSGLAPSIEMPDLRYLKFSTAFHLRLFILISLWKLFWFLLSLWSFEEHSLFCTWFWLYQDGQPFFFLFCINNNAICKMEVGYKLASYVDTFFMTIQCPTPYSLSDVVAETDEMKWKAIALLRLNQQGSP